MQNQMTNNQALKDAWVFMKSNWALSLGATSILVILALMQYLPNVGFAFALAYSILTLSIQIYIGKAVYEDSSEGYMSRLAQNSKLSDFFTKYIDIATGGFLGFFVLMIIFFAILVTIITNSVDMATMQEISKSGMSRHSQEMVLSMLINNEKFKMGILIYFLVILTLSYSFPAVLGKIILAEDFTTAFKRVFLIFSPKLWKSLFNKKYFKLIAIWSLIIFFVSIFTSELFAFIFLIPVAFIILYLISIYNAIIYIFAIKAI